ncbi:MAG: hypothetical protein WCA83_00535 [Azonexus sp.]
MKDTTQDTGMLAVLVERLEAQRLPRALAMKEKVDRGECLDEFDLALLEEVFADSAKLKPLLDRHPEYEQIVIKMRTLYHEITEKGLANEKAGKA